MDPLASCVSRPAAVRFAAGKSAAKPVWMLAVWWDAQCHGASFRDGASDPGADPRRWFTPLLGSVPTAGSLPLGHWIASGAGVGWPPPCALTRGLHAVVQMLLTYAVAALTVLVPCPSKRRFPDQWEFGCRGIGPPSRASWHYARCFPVGQPYWCRVLGGRGRHCKGGGRALDVEVMVIVQASPEALVRLLGAAPVCTCSSSSAFSSPSG